MRWNDEQGQSATPPRDQTEAASGTEMATVVGHAAHSPVTGFAEAMPINRSLRM